MRIEWTERSAPGMSHAMLKWVVRRELLQVRGPVSHPKEKISLRNSTRWKRIVAA